MRIINLNEEALKMNLPLDVVTNAFNKVLSEKNATSFYDFDNSEIVVSDTLEINSLLDRLKVEDIQIASISKQYGISMNQMNLVINQLIFQYNLNGVINSFGEYITDNAIKTRLLKIIEEDENIDLNRVTLKLGLPAKKVEEKIIEFENQVISGIKPFNQIKFQDISHEVGLSEKLSLIFLKWLIANKKIYGSIDMVNEVFIQERTEFTPSASSLTQNSESYDSFIDAQPIQTIIPITPVTVLWYLAPIFFGIIGGIIAYVMVVDRNPDDAKRLLLEGVITTVIYWLLFGGFRIFYPLF